MHFYRASATQVDRAMCGKVSAYAIWPGTQ